MGFGPFLVHFLNFQVKIFFPENLALSHTTYGFPAPCQNLEKLMIQFQKKACTDKMTEGWPDPIL